MKQAMLAGAVMGLAQVAYVSIEALLSSNLRSLIYIGRYSSCQTHQSAQGKYSLRDFICYPTKLSLYETIEPNMSYSVCGLGSKLGPDSSFFIS